MGGHGQISEGSLVRLKNGPPCGPNAVVFTTSPSHGPKVGKTVSVMERSSIDPKTSVLVKVFKDFGLDFSSSACYDLYQSENIYSGLEVWKLSDVVFLDDSPSILGRVVAIDRQQVIIDCSYTEPIFEGATNNTNAAKSSLKVFKTTDLEPCMEGPDFQRATGSKVEGRGVGNFPSGPGGETPSTSSQGGRHSVHSVSRHVSGTVQHRPVLILDPTPVQNYHNGDSPVMENCLRGFRPLAVMATDSGPNLLVERVSDRSSFLVCSSHATTGAMSMSSFVAVGNRDTKVKRCTIAEESVNSVASGLARNVSLLQASSELSNQFKTGSGALSTTGSKPGCPDICTTSSKDSTIGKTLTQSRKGKKVASVETGSTSSRGKRSQKHMHFLQPQPQVAMDTTSVPTSVAASNSIVHVSRDCEFVPLSSSHADMFLIRDISGTIWSLLDGLSLKPSCGPSGHVLHQSSVPSWSYSCISSRQYSTQGQDNVSVFVLGEIYIYK